MSKKENLKEIDEDFIIASMNTFNPTHQSTENKTKEAKQGQLAKVEPILEPKNVEDTREDARKKKTKGNYESLFVRYGRITGRKEKTTYLRTEFYRKIQDILRLYEDPRLSVFGYIDSVLEHHFEAYHQDITDLYDVKYKKPY